MMPKTETKPDDEFLPFGPTTANEAAAMVFPQIAEHYLAFCEKEVCVNGCPYLELMDLNEDFWALSIGKMGSSNPAVFSTSENQFRKFNPKTGIYEPVTESALTCLILANMDQCAHHFPSRLKPETYLCLRNRQRMKSVVERAKDLLAVDDDYWMENRSYHLALKNGILELSSRTLKPFSPSYPIRETLPVKYDPNANCEKFLISFLARVLNPDDVDLLQRYCGQILEGKNHTQTILILTGDAGWGKSTLMKILGNIIGWKRVGIIREQLFRNEFELGHYEKMNLLYHPDMPTDFLDRKEASLFKQLVGGDPLWTEIKGSDSMMTLEGHYPLILACNGKPKIHIDADADAWTRRLVVLSFKKPDDDFHMGMLADLIWKHEAAGILNWLLEGRSKLFKSNLQLTQTPEQRAQSSAILLGSESPQAWVRRCVERQKGRVLWMGDLYEEYQKWCRNNSLRPFASNDFMAAAKNEIEVSYGMRPRHDLVGENGKARRGWAGLVLKSKGTNEKQSAMSA